LLRLSALLQTGAIMTIFLATFIVIGISILIMAVGVMVRRRPISGSCGGLERFDLECDAGCGKPCQKRLPPMQPKPRVTVRANMLLERCSRVRHSV